jgi:hypothetical protein
MLADFHACGSAPLHHLVCFANVPAFTTLAHLLHTARARALRYYRAYILAPQDAL